MDNVLIDQLNELAFNPKVGKGVVHPEKKKWIETGDKELNQLLPQLSGEEKKYLEVIASKSYEELVGRLEGYTGVKLTKSNLPSIISLSVQALNKVFSIEKSRKAELEKLAVDLVFNLDEFKMVKEAYENGDFKLDIKLEPPTPSDILGEQEQVEPGQLSEEEAMNLQLAQLFSNEDENKLRRRFANLLTSGGATLKTYSFHMADSELNAIDKNLTNLYGILATFAQLGYWAAPNGIEKMAANSAGAGSAQVIPSGDIYIMKVRAICFPYLCHELTKCVYEYLSLDPELQGVMGKEEVQGETPDIIAGPEIFKVVSSYIPTNEQEFMPLVQKKVTNLKPDQIKHVLAKDHDGKRIMDQILRDAKEEWQDYKMNQYKYGEEENMQR